MIKIILFLFVFIINFNSFAQNQTPYFKLENSKKSEYDYVEIDSLVLIKGVTLNDLISYCTGIHQSRIETEKSSENKKYDLEFFKPKVENLNQFYGSLKKGILQKLNYSEIEYSKDIIGYEVNSIDTLLLKKSCLEPNSERIVIYDSDGHIYDIKHSTIKQLFTLLTNKHFPFVIFSDSKIEGYYDFRIRNRPNEGTISDLENYGIKLTKIIKKVPHFRYQLKY